MKYIQSNYNLTLEHPVQKLEDHSILLLDPKNVVRRGSPVAAVVEDPPVADGSILPYQTFYHDDNIEFDEESRTWKSRSYGFLYVPNGNRLSLMVPVLTNPQKTKAYLYLYPIQHIPPSIEEIRTVAYQLGIKQLLSNEEILAQIDKSDWPQAEREKKPVRIQFAQGIESQDGWKKYYILKVDAQIKSGQLNDDGSIDFKERNFITEAKKGTPIFEEIPERQVVNGIDIFSKIIKGRLLKHKEYKIGKNIIPSQDNPLLHIASIDGRIFFHNPYVDVNETVYIPSDVDYSTGNIEFQGSLEIKGSVLAGFKVSGGADILIHENIDEGNVECKGSLAVQGGINGSEKSIVRVEGDISAKYIQNARILCEGNVVVEDAIINSDIFCRGKITVSSDKGGKIIGGKVIGKLGITANIVGNTLGNDTFLGARMDPDIFEKYSFHMKRLKELLEDKKAITEEIFHSFGADFMKDPKKILATLPTPRKKQVLTLLNDLQQINQQIRTNQQGAEDLKEILKTPSDVKIEIRKELFPPTKIQLKGSILAVDKKTNRVKYYIPENEGEIKAFYL